MVRWWVFCLGVCLFICPGCGRRQEQSAQRAKVQLEKCELGGDVIFERHRLKRRSEWSKNPCDCYLDDADKFMGELKRRNVEILSIEVIYTECNHNQVPVEFLITYREKK